jgi:hypothetical protein
VTYIFDNPSTVDHPIPSIPRGLCGNRREHDPHMHDSTSLGRFFCHADQSKRLPFMLEQGRK